MDTPWSCSLCLYYRILAGTWRITCRKCFDDQVSKKLSKSNIILCTNETRTFNCWVKHNLNNSSSLHPPSHLLKTKLWRSSTLQSGQYLGNVVVVPNDVSLYILYFIDWEIYFIFQNIQSKMHSKIYISF